MVSFQRILDVEIGVRVFGTLDLKPRICMCALVYGFGNRTNTGYTILIHGLIHILYYIRVTILCYASIVMTLPVVRIYIMINVYDKRSYETTRNQKVCMLKYVSIRALMNSIQTYY
jgi:hypothetical protein